MVPCPSSVTHIITRVSNAVSIGILLIVFDCIYQQNVCLSHPILRLYIMPDEALHLMDLTRLYLSDSIYQISQHNTLLISQMRIPCL